MQSIPIVFTAGGQTQQLNIPGRYFTILDGASAVDVALFRQGNLLRLGRIANWTTGPLAGLEVGPLPVTDPVSELAFDRVEVTSTAAGTITVGIGDGAVRYNRSQGSVNVTTISDRGAVLTPAKKTITSVDTQIIAADAARRHLLIRNPLASARTVWIASNGQAAVADATCYELTAGEIYQPLTSPRGAIRAINDGGADMDVYTEVA